jgi:hypothetical protein
MKVCVIDKCFTNKPGRIIVSFSVFDAFDLLTGIETDK